MCLKNKNFFFNSKGGKNDMVKGAERGGQG